jgi:Flp pilus assembly protein TadG
MSELRRHQNHPGQGLVEFVAVFPVFLMLFFGTIELGWLAFNYHNLTSATREGARFAMVNGEMSGSVATVATVQQVVSERASSAVGTIETTGVTFSPNAEPGSQVTVATRLTYQPIVGMIIGTASFELTSESTVIVQY